MRPTRHYRTMVFIHVVAGKPGHGKGELDSFCKLFCTHCSVSERPHDGVSAPFERCNGPTPLGRLIQRLKLKNPRVDVARFRRARTFRG